MRKEMEGQRERLKERVSNEIDKYYDEISNGLKNRTIQIGIERMLVEKKEQVNELIREATGEAFTEDEAVIEKNDVRDAMSICEGKVGVNE